MCAEDIHTGSILNWGWQLLKSLCYCKRARKVLSSFCSRVSIIPWLNRIWFLFLCKLYSVVALIQLLNQSWKQQQKCAMVLLRWQKITWHPEAIMAECSSCHHQWSLRDLNSMPAGCKPGALTTEPHLFPILLQMLSQMPPMTFTGF